MKRHAWMLVLAVVLGAAIGWWLKPSSAPEHDAAANDAKEGPCPGGKPPLFWRNPMNPAITSPTFQKDEMGMPYIPVCEDGAPASSGGVVVKIDPELVQQIGVRTRPAQRREIARTIVAPARIDWDEAKIRRLSPRISGWVERLFVAESGVFVRKGEPLAEIYSPELAASAAELQLAVRAGSREILQEARRRLRLFGLDDAQIAAIEAGKATPDRLVLRAPFSGVVRKIGAREGERILPDRVLFAIADIRTVWVIADFYEDDAAWLKPGDRVRIEAAGLPAGGIEGRIEFLYPWIDNPARTLRARIRISNEDGRLRPGQFARVVLRAKAHKALAVPKEAVIYTGREPFVFVEIEPGKFEKRTVRLGLLGEEWAEIVAGIREGERVVVSGQFLIDSEASIAEAAAKMAAPKDQSPQDMDMSGMQMDLDLSDMRLDEGAAQ